jgi:hypothetical protein
LKYSHLPLFDYFTYGIDGACFVLHTHMTTLF